MSAIKVSDATVTRDFDYRWQQVFAPGAGHPPRTRNPGSKQHRLRLRQHRANPTLCPRQCPRAGIETARASRRHSGSRTQLVQQDHSSVLRVSTGVSSTVKYRSRLEARWAAIHGTLGVNQDALPGEGRL